MLVLAAVAPVFFSERPVDRHDWLQRNVVKLVPTMVLM